METEALNHRLNQRRWLLLAIIALGLVVSAGLAIFSLLVFRSAKDNDLPVYWELPPFSFTDQLNRPVSAQALRGKVLLANFIYTNCVAFCPTVLSPQMKELQERLRDAGLLGRDVKLLSFSVDPEQDTPQILADYAEQYGADPEAWHFLTGSAGEMRKVVTMGLKFGVQKIEQPVEHTHPEGWVHVHKYDITHTNRFILVDRQGQVRGLYDGVYDWNPDTLLNAVSKLVE
ncbi:MAG: SCO family protein [Dehalococcoidia bacterium]